MYVHVCAEVLGCVHNPTWMCGRCAWVHRWAGFEYAQRVGTCACTCVLAYVHIHIYMGMCAGVCGCRCLCWHVCACTSGRTCMQACVLCPRMWLECTPVCSVIQHPCEGPTGGPFHRRGSGGPESLNEKPRLQKGSKRASCDPVEWLWGRWLSPQPRSAAEVPPEEPLMGSAEVHLHPLTQVNRV